MRRALFRFWRWFLRRDNCEMCDGRSGARGNENIIRGIVMCDDCHVRYGQEP